MFYERKVEQDFKKEWCEGGEGIAVLQEVIEMRLI